MKFTEILSGLVNVKMKKMYNNNVCFFCHFCVFQACSMHTKGGQSSLFLKLKLFININSYYKTMSGMRDPIVSFLNLLLLSNFPKKDGIRNQSYTINFLV